MSRKPFLEATRHPRAPHRAVPSGRSSTVPLVPMGTTSGFRPMERRRELPELQLQLAAAVQLLANDLLLPPPPSYALALIGCGWEPWATVIIVHACADV